MHIAVVGSGAVGGFYGAKLAHAGQQITFVARGVHLRAIRDRGLLIWSPLGDFQVHASAESETTQVGPVDAVLLAVKSYDLGTAAAQLAPLIGPETIVLTLQNGIDAPQKVADVIGAGPVIGGATYLATAVIAPGLIEQTGTHRRIVMGEAFGEARTVTPRVRRLADALAAADVQVEAVADVRTALWEKFILLTSMAAFATAARVPTNTLWTDPQGRAQIIGAMQEVEQVARGEGIPLPPDIIDRLVRYIDALPAAMRPSMLLDLTSGRPLELEALPGAVIRRGAEVGVPTPIMSTLYAVLKPHANGHGMLQPARPALA